MRLQTCDSGPKNSKRDDFLNSILTAPRPKPERTQSCAADLEHARRNSGKGLPDNTRVTRTRKSISEGVREGTANNDTRIADKKTVSQQGKYRIEIKGEIVKNGEVIDGGQAKPMIYLIVSSSGSLRTVVGKTFHVKQSYNGQLCPEELDRRARSVYKQELSIMKAIGPHQRIVSALDIDIIAAPRNTLFTEYHSSGDLCTWTNDAWLPEVALWKILYQISQALAFLHYGKGTPDFNPEEPYARPYAFIHRDIKYENILVDGPKFTKHEKSHARKADFKLCDFGLAQKIYRDYRERPERYTGTRVCQAPELAHFPYLPHPKGDIYELGAALCQLLTGREPLSTPCNENCDEQFTGACKATTEPSSHSQQSTFCQKRSHELGLPKMYSERLLTVISRCMSINVSMRPTAIELCRHIEPVYDAIQAGAADGCKTGAPLAF